VTLALAAPVTAEAAEGKFSAQSKITSFSTVNGRLVANGTLAGTFSAGGETTREGLASAFESCSVARGAATCSR
jgi:hypothetical protein